MLIHTRLRAALRCPRCGLGRRYKARASNSSSALISAFSALRGTGPADKPAARLEGALAKSRPRDGKGSYRGFRLTLEADSEHKPELIFSGSRSYRREFGSVAAGNLFNYIDSTVESLPRQARRARDEARLKASQLEGFRARMGQRFDQEDRLDRFLLRVAAHVLKRQY